MASVTGSAAGSVVEDAESLELHELLIDVCKESGAPVAEAERIYKVLKKNWMDRRQAILERSTDEWVGQLGLPLGLFTFIKRRLQNSGYSASLAVAAAIAQKTIQEDEPFKDPHPVFSNDNERVHSFSESIAVEFDSGKTSLGLQDKVALEAKRLLSKVENQAQQRFRHPKNRHREPRTREVRNFGRFIPPFPAAGRPPPGSVIPPRTDIAGVGPMVVGPLDLPQGHLPSEADFQDEAALLGLVSSDTANESAPNVKDKAANKATENTLKKGMSPDITNKAHPSSALEWTGDGNESNHAASSNSSAPGGNMDEAASVDVATSEPAPGMDKEASVSGDDWGNSKWEGWIDYGNKSDSNGWDRSNWQSKGWQDWGWQGVWRGSPTRKIATLRQVADCPGGHGLHEFVTADDRWGCSLCEQRQPTGIKMFGCRECDYDVCTACRLDACGHVTGGKLPMEMDDSKSHKRLIVEQGQQWPTALRKAGTDGARVKLSDVNNAGSVPQQSSTQVGYISSSRQEKGTSKYRLPRNQRVTSTSMTLASDGLMPQMAVEDEMGDLPLKFTKEYYLNLPVIRPTSLLMQFVTMHASGQYSSMSVQSHNPILNWAYETGAGTHGTFKFKAHCSFMLSGQVKMYAGGWKPNKKAAEADCAAGVLEAFAVDPQMYGGRIFRQLVANQSNQEEKLRESTVVSDVHLRIAMRFKKLIQPNQSLIEWTYNADPGCDQKFQAMARVFLLQENPPEVLAPPEVFVGDWLVGKKAAARNTCLQIQNYLVTVERLEAGLVA